MTYNNKDGVIKTSKCEKGVIIRYIDPNDFIKQQRGLRTYYMRSYKDLVFNVSHELKKPREDGDYVIKLYTEETFKKVYGDFELRYYVENGIVIIKELAPRQLLIDLHRSLLQTYKGVPYRNKLDLLKIKLLIGD